MSYSGQERSIRDRLPVGWRDDVGSSVTFTLLLVYLLAIPLKFQIRWILVYVQLSLVAVVTLRVLSGFDRVEFTSTQLRVVVILAVTLLVTIIVQILRPPHDLSILPRLTRFLVVTLVCIIELRSWRRVHRTLTAVTAAAATIGLLSIFNVFITLPFAFTGPARSFGLLPVSIPRSLGIWMSFGSYGIFAITGLSYAGLSFWRPETIHANSRWSPGFVRTLSAAVLVVLLVAVYVGKSRSTVLAVTLMTLLALAVTAFHSDREIRARHYGVPRSILLLGFVGFFLGARTFQNAFIGANTTSVSGRLDQYRFAVQLLLERPLFGWGWDGFTAAFPTSYTVHNMWLFLGVSLGVPVLVLWLYLFVRLGRDVVRMIFSSVQAHRGFGVVGCGLLIGGVMELALYPGFTPSAAMLVGLLTAIVGLPAAARSVES